MLTKLGTFGVAIVSSVVLICGGPIAAAPPGTSAAGQSGSPGSGGDPQGPKGTGEGGKSQGPTGTGDGGKSQGPTGTGDGGKSPLDPVPDPKKQQIYDRWNLTPPNLDIQNLPIVVAKSLDGKRLRHTNAMVIATASNVWLITLLDGLVFESGRRTVDIELLQCKGAECTACETMKDIDSFRFRWVPEAPDHCVLELSKAEIKQLSTCKTWTFVPIQDDEEQIVAPTASDADGAASTAIAIEAPWVDGTSDGRYSAAIASASCNAEDLHRPDGFTAIRPSVDVPAGGAPFIRTSKSDGRPTCVGIGDTRGTPEVPITQVLNVQGITSLIEPTPPAEQRKVTERLMLERALRRWQNPEGYTAMREFVAENGLDRLVTWRIAALTNGRLNTTYTFAHDPMGTGRAIATVSQTGADALALQLLTPTNRGQGTERIGLSNAVVAVKAERLNDAGTPTLDVSTTAPSSADVLIIETSPSTNVEPEQLPPVGK
jgi:hypothetical protein